MRERRPTRSQAPGFTLPAVMIVAAAMLILAVGLLAIISIERKTARSFADSKRAELAARAGLEDFNAILRAETANDDYLVIGRTSPNVEPDSLKEAPSQLFLARGKGGGANLDYRYIPLFSAREIPAGNKILEAPEIAKVDDDDEEDDQIYTPIDTLPWQDAPRVEWIPVEDEEGAVVARYAYWVEDLQGKLDAKTAGNTKTDRRTIYPFPAPGLNPEPPTEEEPKLDEVAIDILDPDAKEDLGNLSNRLIEGRPAMLSPDAVVAAAGFQAPLKRILDTGLLEDKVAAALEKSASSVIEPYKERPTVPFALGISGEAAGKPKLNLNALLRKSRSAAINEFAEFVDSALPDFSNERKGGFPEDYLKTLAANAFDYADADSDATIQEGTYRGLDAYPLSSEIILHVQYLGQNADGNLMWKLKLFVELWNMTNRPVSGKAEFSYEVGLATSGIGAGVAGKRFDDPSYLDNGARSTHNLTKRGNKYWSAGLNVQLRANEYKMYEVAAVDYRLPGGGSPTSGTEFTVSEPLGAGGLSMTWNDETVERINKIVRTTQDKVFFTNRPTALGFAAIPAHSYGPYGVFVNNMGDPRISNYVRTVELGQNAYPGNISPNRRNIRRSTIYDGDAATKPKHYGRVQPAEWPDGGHNSQVGSWSVSTTDSIEPTDSRYTSGLPTPMEGQAPQRISNAGRFYSATELGNVYDPVMWRPTFGDAPPGSGAGTGPGDTATFHGSAASMPKGRTFWPDVEVPSPANNGYGGGNSLRLGRAEHPLFDRPGIRASHLLDLFHAGDSTSEETSLEEGELLTMAGNVNLNTASADAIRALVAGTLKQDPLLSQTTSTSHQGAPAMAKPVTTLKIGAPTTTKIADQISQTILLRRPFASAAEVATAKNAKDEAVFGNRAMYSQNARIEWSDSAAEEVFARLYNSSTLRSRNFRIWVIGQAISTPPGRPEEIEILAESKKVFTVFADPGERQSDGAIDPAQYRPRVTHENDF